MAVYPICNGGRYFKNGGFMLFYLNFTGGILKLRVILIRAKDGKRIEKTDDFSTPEKVNASFSLFYPKTYKAYAIYDGEKLLYSKGKID